MFSTDEAVLALISRWREDPRGTYQTWFLWEQRLKNFRSIRRGISEVVAEIETNTFGNVYKGSSLEVVVGSIAEQRQMFKGADHAFLWKPKLRIPDIYENRENQLAFGRFLNFCMCCTGEDAIIDTIHSLDRRGITGLGPAAANLLYFLHPTLVLPTNTAIVNGYNALRGARVKLGRWDEYLAMRKGAMELNAQYRSMLSNDLGAVAGLLFDIGIGQYAPPPREDDATARAAWQADLDRVREESSALERMLAVAHESDSTHAEVQGWLRDLGRALGFDVWIAANDRSRGYADGRLGDGCVDALPQAVEGSSGADSVRLIDVIWIRPADGQVVAAFEVEHTTSIYSGILRLQDLAFGAVGNGPLGLYLVAPDKREGDVRAQLARPAFRGVRDLHVRFLPYSELEKNRLAMAKFGQGMKAIEAVARSLVM